MSLLLEQLITFFILIGAGLTMALVFDLYRIFRWMIKLPKMLFHLFDLLIWLILAVAVFFLLILGNWGEVRFYVFLGLIIGLTLYFKFFSRKVIKFLLRTIKFMKKVLKFSVKIFIFPVKIIGKILGTILLVPLGLITFIYRKMKK